MWKEHPKFQKFQVRTVGVLVLVLLGLYLGFAVANRDWDSLMHTLLFVVAVVAFIVASGLVVGFVWTLVKLFTWEDAGDLKTRVAETAGVMSVPVFYKSVTVLRRFLFAIAGVYMVVSVLSLCYWLFSGRSMMSLAASVFDAVPFLATFVIYVGGFFISANLIVELFRIFRPSTRTWTDGRHLKTVARLLLGVFACLVLLFIASCVCAVINDSGKPASE